MTMTAREHAVMADKLLDQIGVSQKAVAAAKLTLSDLDPSGSATSAAEEIDVIAAELRWLTDVAIAHALTALALSTTNWQGRA